MHPYHRHERTTDAPISVDVSGSDDAASAASRLGIPPSWVTMGGYLAGGIFLGLLLILALSFSRRDAAAASAASSNAVTDSVIRLHARDIAASCWVGHEKLGPARLTVALEVGIDGKIRYAAASGESPTMRSCVESHVRAWEFLPQAQAQTMALPVEVDRR
jgi:hypothetical protein